MVNRPDFRASISAVFCRTSLTSSLLDGFLLVEPMWQNVYLVQSVSNFKTITSYRLVGKDQNELIALDSELEHITGKRDLHPAGQALQLEDRVDAEEDHR